MTAPTFKLVPIAAAVLVTLFMAPNVPLSGDACITRDSLKALLPGWPLEYFDEQSDAHLRLVVGLFLMAFDWPAGAFFCLVFPALFLSVEHAVDVGLVVRVFAMHDFEFRFSPVAAQHST